MARIFNDRRSGRFDEIEFYDAVTGALRTAQGIVCSTRGYANQLDEEHLAAALGAAEEKLDAIAVALSAWDEDRAARSKAEQARVDAAKVACGVGDTLPRLNAQTRRHLRKLLSESDPKRRNRARVTKGSPRSKSRARRLNSDNA